jgi:hypothetical protein
VEQEKYMESVSPDITVFFLFPYGKHDIAKLFFLPKHCPTKTEEKE